MPLSVLPPPSCALNFSRTPSTTSVNMNPSLFGSIKSKMSRKNSHKSETSRSTSTFAPASHPFSNPFQQPSQPTRRPNRNHMAANSTPIDPPPAYTPNAPATQPAAPASNSNHGSDNDPYAFLSSFDTIFIIDDSGSMIGSSWRETQRALEAITPVCTAHDADGIDLYFLNAPDNEHYHNVKSAATVREIFSTVRPRGQTPLGTRLNKILRPYLDRYARNPETTKPINVIVITDGEPSDDPETVIVYAARKLNRLDAAPWQVGIQFFQVGREPGAREYLLHLDNNLEDSCDGRDMVDTQPWKNQDGYELNGDGILKAVLGSVNKRLDNKKDTDLYGLSKPKKRQFF